MSSENMYRGYDCYRWLYDPYYETEAHKKPLMTLSEKQVERNKDNDNTRLPKKYHRQR